MYVFLFTWRKFYVAHFTTHIGQVETREKSGAKPQSDQYQTLAQFYAAIKDGKPYNQTRHSSL